MPYMGQTAVASRSNGWETMGKRGDACRSHAPHTAPRSRSKRHARRCGHPRTSHSNGRRPLSDVYGIGCAKLEKIELSILTGIIPEQQKEAIMHFEKRLSNVKELAKYDK